MQRGFGNQVEEAELEKHIFAAATSGTAEDKEDVTADSSPSAKTPTADPSSPDQVPSAPT